ncbi:MAG: hypothetical protein GWM90_31460, partial [Gemmatimonadetes bacterium]|nr:hypothetical protein [Gemmatimonadota bacterium]NIQ59751.1 hypothetical protein [Gemmatimonadota bacterium]NIU79953.1 hypothetical protein [Gammaproteobacteria bacterium]NIX48415.1 hypothetical protein [Gemmatimonadota bacterium]NIY12850.1 hypothetical protein [Gemmatimonadota bacterium]
MAITDRDLAELRDAGIIDAGTADRIRAWSAGRAPRDADAADEPGWFDPARTAYYLGAVLILFALGWFALEAWKRYGGWTLAGVALAYGALFAWLGDRLWRGGERVAGGLLFTAAAGMTPLLVFSVQAGLGVWPDAAARAGPEHYRALAGHRVVMEAATILVLLLAIRLRPFAFHAAALAAAVVALAFDL